jgi:Arc/MetJ-type ribon-helix-helix transcriptional regulator
MPLSVRLDSATQARVGRLARRRGVSRSEVVRAAIAALAQDDEAPNAGTVFDAVGHLVGCMNSGGINVAARTGEAFAALLQERARARRAG